MYTACGVSVTSASHWPEVTACAAAELSSKMLMFSSLPPLMMSFT